MGCPLLRPPFFGEVALALLGQPVGAPDRSFALVRFHQGHRVIRSFRGCMLDLLHQGSGVDARC